MRYWLVLLLFVSGVAFSNSTKHAQYGVAYTATFYIYLSTGLWDVDEADGGAEITLHCDEDAGTNPITNDFVDEGSYYSIVLTAAEMECARIVLDINATQQELVNIETFGDVNSQDSSEGVASGTAQSCTASTLVMDADAAFATNELQNSLVTINGGTGDGQTRHIASTATDTLTLSAAWTTTCDSTSEYMVQASSQGFLEIDANGYASVDVKEMSDLDPEDQVADAVWEEEKAGHVTASTFGDLAVDADMLVEAMILTGVEFVADSGTVSTIVDAALTQADDNFFRDATIHFTAGQANINGQTACANNFSQAGDSISFSPALTQAVAAGATYYLTFGGCERGR